MTVVSDQIRGLGFIMFFDLNVPVPQRSSATLNQLKKGKGKGNAPHHASAVVYTPALLGAIEARVDLLVHCQCFPPPSVFEPFDVIKGSRIYHHCVQPNSVQKSRSEDACQRSG
jgi:hypothetical protein